MSAKIVERSLSHGQTVIHTTSIHMERNNMPIIRITRDWIYALAMTDHTFVWRAVRSSWSIQGHRQTHARNVDQKISLIPSNWMVKSVQTVMSACSQLTLISIVYLERIFPNKANSADAKSRVAD